MEQRNPGSLILESTREVCASDPVIGRTADKFYDTQNEFPTGLGQEEALLSREPIPLAAPPVSSPGPLSRCAIPWLPATTTWPCPEPWRRAVKELLGLEDLASLAAGAGLLFLEQWEAF